jgi:hypothetical protein
MFGSDAAYRSISSCRLKLDAAVFLHWLNERGNQISQCLPNGIPKRDLFDTLLHLVHDWSGGANQGFLPLLQFVAVSVDPILGRLPVESRCQLARRRVWRQEAHRVFGDVVHDDWVPFPTDAIVALVSSDLRLFGARHEQRFRHFVLLLAKMQNLGRGFHERLEPVMAAYSDPDLGPRWTLRTLKRYPKTLSPARADELAGRVPSEETMTLKAPFVLQVASAKAIRRDFAEAPFSHVPDPLAFLERSWVKEGANVMELWKAADAEKSMKAEKGHFGHFPWISALLLFPLAWYFGTIRAVVDVEVTAACG